MKATELLTFIGSKMGIDISQHLSPGEQDFDISDDVKALFDKEIFTFDAAKNNIKLKNHFTSAALDGVDHILNEHFDKFGFSPDEVAELNGIRNTYERHRKFGEILSSKKQQATPQPDDEIKKLNDQILALKRENQSEKEKYISEYENNFRNFVLTEAILKRPLDVDRFGDSDTAIAIAKMKLEKELLDKGIDLKRVDKSLKMVQKTNPEMDYYIDNSPAQFDTFLDRLLADAKLLKITDPEPSIPSVTPQRSQQPRSPNQPNASMLSKLDQAMAEFNGGSKPV